MKFIRQTRLHDKEKGIHGNCTEACIASFLEIDIDQVPELRFFAHKWFDAMEMFFHVNGYEIYLDCDPPEDKEAYYFGTGMSPRGVRHCTIWQGDKMVWDPHPSDDGIELENVWIIEKR